MAVALTILVAVALGAAWVLVTALLRVRRPRQGVPAQADGPVADLLAAYREARYDDVVAAAPGVMRTLHDPRWQGRLELVLGHSFFQLDRYAEAIPHLEAGLAANQAQRPEGEARFAHCLGWAYQATDRPDRARAVYQGLLADADLDPTVRDAVQRHLDELDRED